MNKSGEKNTSKNKIIFAVLLVILVFLLGLCAGLYFAPKHESISGGVEFFTDTGNSSLAESSVAERGVVIPGITAVTVPANETEVFLGLCNPAENSGAYYLTFELKVNINGKYETLYTSGLVEAGKNLGKITLSRPLDCGEYNAVLHIQPYRADKNLSGLTATNNADIVLKITAK